MAQTEEIFKFVNWLWSKKNTRYEYLAERIKIGGYISSDMNIEIQKLYDKFKQESV